MADLPDLDKNQISFIAYWNATDHGVDSIAPDEALSDGSIQEYVLYDNGWEGTYTLENGRNARVRIKNDGWIIAYIDRSASYATQTYAKEDVIGPWDVLADWANDDDSDNRASLTDSALHRAIKSLRDELSNSASITYSDGDVGLYDYRNTSSTTLTLLNASIHKARGAGGVSSNPTFLYTSGTTRYEHTTIGAGRTGRENYPSATASFEGQTLASIPTDSGRSQETQYGVIDTLGQGLTPSAGTEYSGTLSSQNGSFDNYDAYATLIQFVSWG